MFALLVMAILLLLAGKWVFADESQGGQTGSQGGDGQGTGTGGGTGSSQGGTDGEGDEDEKGLTVAEALKRKRQSDNEAKNLRARLHETEQKLKGFEQSQMTESQKKDALLKQLQEESAKHQQTAADAQYELYSMKVERRLTRLAPDALDPELLMEKIDLSEVVTDKGEIDEKALTASLLNLRKLYPRQFSGARHGQDAASGSGAGGSAFNMNQAIRRAAGR